MVNRRGSTNTSQVVHNDLPHLHTHSCLEALRLDLFQESGYRPALGIEGAHETGNTERTMGHAVHVAATEHCRVKGSGYKSSIDCQH